MSDYRRRVVIASEGGGGTIAPDFSTATWAEIQAYINENGTADYAEQIGKTRPVTLSDSSEHTLRLANATGNLYELADGSGYTGMIVEFADVIDASTKMQSSGAYTSPLDIVDPMGTTTLPAIQATLPQELQSILANVKVVTTKSYNDATLVSCNMKLFIPSINEILGSTGGGYASTAELNISARWANYVANDNYDYRKKRIPNGSSNEAWWLRTPVWGASSAMCCIAPNGNVSTLTTSSTYRVSPCFCLAPQPFVPPIQPLKYIESTGTQYIDTDIVPSSNTKTLISFNSGAMSSNFKVYGTRSSQTVTGFFAIGKYNSNVYASYGTTEFSYSLWTANTDYTISMDSSSVVQNGVTVGTFSSSTMSTTYPLYLFACNNYGTEVAQYGSFKAYSFKIYGQNDTLVRDYVPCALTEAVTDYWGNPQAIGAVGLWDNVSRKFFPNNGTGDLVAGDPVVPVPDFATATWGEIQTYINNYGTAGFADQVGATRSVTLTDTTTHTLRLVNATGNLYELSDGSGYTGMVVEFADLLQQSAWNTTRTNAGGWAACYLNNTVMPTIEAILPADLRNILPTVKVISAKSGGDGTLVSADNKLFIPAQKELYGSASGSLDAEANALTWWKYYQDNSDASYKVKNYNGTASTWWTRSPMSGQDRFVKIVNSAASNINAQSLADLANDRVCPCFCLAKQPPTPTSFADDDWETIQYAIDHDLASSVYSVGDTKSITLSDNSTHTLRIANMDGNLYELSDGTGYTGFIVEFADCVTSSAWASNNSNTGSLGSAAPMGTTTLPAIKALLPQGLQDILATVKVLKSNNGTDGTLVSSDMDLFLPALKEVYGGNDSTPEEQAALTRWQYYSNTSNYTKKYNNTVVTWWMRSPYKTSTSSIWVYSSTYVWDVKQANVSYYVSPCFCLAKTPPTPPDFSTDSWSDIQAYINEYGTAGFADQVGKTREITLSDSSTHTLCLVNAVGNMYELSDGSGYTGMIVDFVELFAKVAYSSSSTNAGAFADVDPLGKTTLPAIEATLPQELRDIIPSVKVLKANSGTDSTLVSSDMKLFTPTIKEVIGSYGDGTFTESNAFTQWKYMSDNPQYRSKKLNGSPANWWTRSPARSATSNACSVNNGGGSSTSTGYTNAVSPCFCLAPTPTPPTPTPTSFADDDWATIKYAVDNNLASAVYSVGDTKTITLSDSSTHTLRIANITGNLYEYADNAGTYTGFVVEFADILQKTAFISSGTYNTGALDGLSPLGTTVLPAIEATLPNDLLNVLANVVVIKAYSGNDGETASSCNMKVFIPSIKEITGNEVGTTNVEYAFPQWAYYSNSSASKIKQFEGVDTSWWSRSPYGGLTYFKYITNWGTPNAGEGRNSNIGVSPCFCI